MDRIEKLEAQIEQNTADQQKLRDEQKRLQRELAESEITYSEGDRFVGPSGKYLLVYVSAGCSLVGLKNGHFYYSCVQVEDITAVTPKEFRKICSCGQFTRYWDAQKGEYHKT